MVYNRLVQQLNDWAVKKLNSSHPSNAAGAFRASGYDDATVICVGRESDAESLTIWNINSIDSEKVFSQVGPHSIGMWYSSMLNRVGITLDDVETFETLADQGYAERLFLTVLQDFIDTTGCGFDPTTKLKRNLTCGCLDWRTDLTSHQDLCDIAAATQQVYVYVIHNILTWSKTYLPSENLILVGTYDLTQFEKTDLSRFYSHVIHYNTLKSLTKITKVV